MPACCGTSPFTSQREAWKSSMKICACKSDVVTYWPCRISRAPATPAAFLARITVRRKIRNRYAGAHRTLPRKPGDRHRVRPCLVRSDRSPGARDKALLAEAGNAAENMRGLISRRPIVDPQPPLHVGPKVLDHHVGVLDQALEGGETLRRLEVERDARLLRCRFWKSGALARSARRSPMASAGRLDLDHVGAPIGQLAHAGRTGTDLRQIEHREAFERARSFRGRHSRDPTNASLRPSGARRGRRHSP